MGLEAVLGGANQFGRRTNGNLLRYEIVPSPICARAHTFSGEL